MPSIEVNGAALAYTDTGPRGAPAVLFGHGLLFGGWMFGPQVEALSDRFRCVTIDWRGQGDSPPARGGYDMDTLTGDAVALIDALGLAPVHWVGLSMGGFVGQRIAVRHGELLRTLTLLDTSAEAEDPAKAHDYKLLALVQRVFGIRPVLGRVTPLLFGPGAPADAVGEWRRRIARANRAALRQAVLGVANRKAVTHELGRITVPALVVAGAEDRAIPPAESARMADGIAGARLEVVENCGHSSTLEQPAEIVRLLTTFLERPEESR
ncbi:alpha/beta fold hydrolase [Amycolatopsis acidicola]|uniref:Alpha/beta fold hydrolase n=1 Tax=Amycolatopsis acidicola TaxID=2596893 RepID=A0A5N0V1R1_9PSEU|nr:alpha/beta fold hydrolase [Amycolatopsis acidicola]KAA9159630.1 alpha/beta fold hydrolase [Amycolatopsis acidicola]